MTTTTNESNELLKLNFFRVRESLYQLEVDSDEVVCKVDNSCWISVSVNGVPFIERRGLGGRFSIDVNTFGRDLHFAAVAWMDSSPRELLATGDLDVSLPNKDEDNDNSNEGLVVRIVSPDAKQRYSSKDPLRIGYNVVAVNDGGGRSSMMDVPYTVMLYVNHLNVVNRSDSEYSFLVNLGEGEHAIGAYVYLQEEDRVLSSDMIRVSIRDNDDDESSKLSYRSVQFQNWDDCIEMVEAPIKAEILIRDGPSRLFVALDNVVIFEKYIEDYGQSVVEVPLPRMTAGGHVLFAKLVADEIQMLGWDVRGFIVGDSKQPIADKFLEMSRNCPDAWAYGGTSQDNVEGLCASAMRECAWIHGKHFDASNIRNNETHVMKVHSSSSKEVDVHPIVVVTHHTNRPDFIRLQYRSFRRWLAESYEDNFVYIVAYDSKNPEKNEQLKNECNKLKHAACVHIPSQKSTSDTAAARVGDTLQWIWDDILLPKYNESKVLIVDGDVFMISPFSIRDALNTSQISGVLQCVEGFSYIASQFMLFDMYRLEELASISFGYLPEEGCDVACSLALYVQNHPQVRIARIHHTSHVAAYNHNKHVLPVAALTLYKDAFTIEIFGKAFLHYGSASNWKAGHYLSSMDFQPDKTRVVFWLVESCINGSVTMPLTHTYAYPNPHPHVYWQK